MREQPPILDNRTAADVYRQALDAARVFCPQWANQWPADPGYFNSVDNGMVILKLVARMTESILAEVNRIPEKHKIAFYDTIGINLLTAKPAEVPLTFNLAKGANEAFVEKGSRVALAGNDKIVYETVDGLSVIPFKISAACSFNTWNDRYSFHENIQTFGNHAYSIFGTDPDEKNCGHRLVIGNDLVFQVTEPTEVTVEITVENIFDPVLLLPLFKTWRQHGGELDITQTVSGKKIVNKIVLNPLKEKSNSSENYNIEILPAEDINFGDPKFIVPGIVSIKLAQTAAHIGMDFAYANKSPLDLIKGGYPFSKKPEIRDAFYIGSSYVFKKAGAKITLNVKCANVSIANPLSLVWEYWDGKSWVGFPVTDGTNNFKQSGQISFTCPAIPENKTNGKQSRWIRARIDSGDYGTGSWNDNVKQTITIDNKPYTINYVVYNKETYDSPFIEEINCNYEFPALLPQIVITENYGETKELDAGKPFFPYILKIKEDPAFYIGCEQKFSGKALSLFFPFQKRLFNEPLKKIEKPGSVVDFGLNPQFEWQYFNGADWKRIENISDETNGLNEQGIFNFIIPPDIDKTTIFGIKNYWIRLALINGNWIEAPRITGIFPNTVNALNQVVIKNETLGSSNGKPDQVFEFSKKPILEGQVIVVVEPELPGREEIDNLAKEIGENPIEKIINDSGNISEVYVRWHEVDDFTLSKTSSRHYMLNRRNGTLIFGDGEKGAIPPKGRNNIISIKFASGGGKNGNAVPLNVKALKQSIPNISSAANYADSAGGIDPESMSGLLKRAPYTLRTKDRAVTSEDYEWLAKEADPIVYRARSLRSPGGDVEVYILPVSDDAIPLPTAQTIKKITEFLKQRTLFVLQSYVKVSGPQYRLINADVTFKPLVIGETSKVRKNIEQAITKFFHPVRGNSNGLGWDFGQDVYTSDLSVILEEVEGVDFIIRIVIADSQGKVSVEGIGKIEMPANFIAACGEVVVSAGQ